MARILIYAADILPLGDLPASSGGSRALQLKRSLELDGHEVLVSCPTETFLGASLGDGLPEELERLSWSRHGQARIFERVRPELVIFGSNWGSVEGSWWPDVPTVLDLCGPVLIEAGLTGELDAESLNATFRLKLDRLARADYLLFGGERQQWYFRLAMLLAGWDPLTAPPCAVLRLGVDPELIQPRTWPEEPIFCYAGGLYPWQDPTLAILTVLAVIEERGFGRLHWYGGSHSLTKLDRDRQTRISAALGRSKRAEVHGYRGYRAICRTLRECSVSVELMARNMERELALTTRTPLALGLGLPVLYPESSELGELIRRAEAGWVGSGDDAAEIRALIEGILDDPEELRRRGENAMRLAREELAWDRLAGPLLEFCRNPMRRPGRREQPIDEDLLRLTTGERWILKRLRSPLLAPLRNMVKPLFRPGSRG